MTVAVPAVPATGIGSLPSELADGRFLEATRIIAGELPLPHIAELPGLGAGADLLGRTGALLAQVSEDLAWEAVPDGWRRTSAPGRDMRRAWSWWSESLDALEQVLASHTGAVKVQLAGPWTLAAGMRRDVGERALSDAGLVRDLSAALAAATADHVREVRRRLPHISQVIVQLDEPSLPAVLSGAIATHSGFGRLAPVPGAEAAPLLARVAESAHAEDAPVVVHCCALGVPWQVLAEAQVDGVSLDATLLRDDSATISALETWLDAGRRLWWGVVPATGPSTVPTEGALVDGALARLEFWRARLSLDEITWAAQVTVTPTCGLAGATAAWARAAMAATRQAGVRVAAIDEVAREEAVRHE